MTTSGTWDFNPNLGSATIFAFNLCGIRSSSLLQEHMESARMASNMLLGRWSSQGVNTWTVDLQTIPLVAGQATYTVPSNTIVMLDAYTTQGSPATNRIIMPVSRTEYASYSNPEQQGIVTVFWMDRLLSPTVTFYLTPDGSQTSVQYYRVRQIQDAGFAGGQTMEIPAYWVEAFCFGLALRLAMIWAPDRVGMLKAAADEAYAIAANQNTETENFYLTPQLAGYFR